MSGVANTPKTDDVCNSMQSSINLDFTATEETMEQTETNGSSSVRKTHHTKHTSFNVSVAGLLVALIPEGYFDTRKL